MKSKQIISILLTLLFLVACGANSADQRFSEAAYDTAAPAPMEAWDAGEGASNVSMQGQTAVTGQTQTIQRLIIRTADLELIVNDTEEAMAQISQLAEQTEGWVVSTDLWAYGDNAQAGAITIRVPATGFNSAIAALKSMAVEVERESSSGQDVTEEYIDLESQLANLEATAVRVRAFLDEAKTVEEALDVNQELSRLEGEIEVIKGRMQYLSQSAAYSTITVSLTPNSEVQPLQVAGWRPQGVAKDAVEALIDTLQGVADFLIWAVIYLLPVGLVVILPLWLVGRFIWRRLRRKQA